MNVGIAAGTILAVLVALFGEQLKAKFLPPKLRINLRDQRGEKTILARSSPSGTVEHLDDVRYFHVRISNQRRTSPAHGVQVYLTTIQEPKLNGYFQTVWVGEVPLQWRDQQVNTITQTIGADKDCDFCMVRKEERTLYLLPLVVPNNLNARRKGACSFVASLQARSNEADSETVHIEVKWDGRWEDNDIEMQQHLVVRCFPQTPKR